MSLRTFDIILDRKDTALSILGRGDRLRLHGVCSEKESVLNNVPKALEVQ